MVRSWVVLRPAEFEKRIGWGTPPIPISSTEWVVLTYALCRDLVHRVFAVLLRLDGEELRITGVSEYYVMEPQTPYERLGERPLVIKPCGAVLIHDKILLTYGASDTYTCFAEISLPDLLSVIKELPHT